MDVYPGRDRVYQVDHTGPGRDELRHGRSAFVGLYSNITLTQQLLSVVFRCAEDG